MSIAEIVQQRSAAMSAGMDPVIVEVGPTAATALGIYGLGIETICGMRVKRVSEDRIRLLCMPNRRIGRYEVVAPVPFEDAA